MAGSKVEELVRQLGITPVQIRRMGKAGYLIADKNKTGYFLKTQPLPVKMSSIIASLLIGGNILFKREIRINQCLARNHFTYLKYPRLLKTDGKEYMLFQYIQGREGFYEGRGTKKKAVLSLLEFNRTPVSFSSSLIESILIKYFGTEATLFRDTAGPLRGKTGLVCSARIIIVFLKACLFTRRNKKALLLHNDLEPINIITGDDGTLNIIDFEDATLEYKWLLCDIVYLVFDCKTLDFDKELLFEYIRRLKENGYLVPDLYSQLRIALLRRCGRIIRHPHYLPEEKRKAASFIKDILSRKAAYSKWFSEFVSI